MKRFHCVFFGAALLFAATAHAEERTLAEAERAYQHVDFPNTHTLAGRALEAGGGTREQTARCYVLLGISAAALGDTDEAKQDFMRALAVDPTFKLDAGVSPKIREPYLEAKGHWSASAERLTLQAKPSSDGAHLILQLVDPASLVTKLELRIAAPGVQQRPVHAFTDTKLTRFPLPSGLQERGYEYALRALDRYGNVIAEQGTESDPQIVRGASAARAAAANGRSLPERRSYLRPATLGVAGLAAVTVGVVFHLARERDAHTWNGPSCENPGQTRLEQCESVDSRRQSAERLAIGFYAAGGALLTGSLIALVAGRAAPTERVGLGGCSLAGKGLVCDGRF